MRCALALLAALCLAPAALRAQGQGTVSGLATAVDGSTLEIDGKTYHLADTIAPGGAQSCTRPGGASWPCGEAAAAKLKALIAGQVVRCSVLGRDIDRVEVAVCYAGEVEINRAMIGSGLAVVHWQLGLDYAEVQAVARAAHVGLWQGDFEDPWDWRQKHTPGKVPPA